MPRTARRLVSRVRINPPRTGNWRCTLCDTWNGPTDRRCISCG